MKGHSDALEFLKHSQISRDLDLASWNASRVVRVNHTSHKQASNYLKSV